MESIEQTKKHILEVARQEFFKKGFAATSINAVVDAANITKPTVYYHFKNKEGLFAALVKEAYDDCFEHRREHVDEDAPITEQIYQVVAADFAFCLAEPALVHFVLSLTFPLPDEQTIDLQPIHLRDYEFFKQIIERGQTRAEINQKVDSVTAALALQGTIAINIMSFLKMGHEIDFLSNVRAKQVAEFFLGGIRLRKAII
ncbi:MAG: TetR/AcrR family transcriptional regulator [Pyrinomonadaceae bacterium]